MRVLRSVAELLAPPRCVSCGVRADLPWCAGCGREATAREIDLATACPRCGGTPGAPACWPADAPLIGSVIAARYGGPWADAIVAGKVRGAHAVWRPLGEVLAARLPDAAAEVDVVTWVPTPARRRRRRGCDHARLLAEAAASGWGRPLARLLEAAPGTPDRGAVDRIDRPDLPAGAFRARGPVRARVLLVDDVVTTGATAWHAARALREAGAQVRVAALTRAGRHPLGPGPGAAEAAARSP